MKLDDLITMELLRNNLEDPLLLQDFLENFKELFPSGVTYKDIAKFSKITKNILIKVIQILGPVDEPLNLSKNKNVPEEDIIYPGHIQVVNDVEVGDIFCGGNLINVTYSELTCKNLHVIGDIDLNGVTNVHGNLTSSEHVSFRNTAFVGGLLSTSRDLVTKDLDCFGIVAQSIISHGTILSEREILSVDIYCSNDLLCMSNIKSGNITCEGKISCGTFLESSGNIEAEKGIRAGSYVKAKGFVDPGKGHYIYAQEFEEGNSKFIKMDKEIN